MVQSTKYPAVYRGRLFGTEFKTKVPRKELERFLHVLTRFPGRFGSHVGAFCCHAGLVHDKRWPLRQNTEGVLS